MKDEYDFSDGERGKFYRPNAQLHIPIYLDNDIAAWCTQKAKNKGINMQLLVNNLLRKDISLIQEIIEPHNT